LNPGPPPSRDFPLTVALRRNHTTRPPSRWKVFSVLLYNGITPPSPIEYLLRPQFCFLACGIHLEFLESIPSPASLATINAYQVFSRVGAQAPSTHRLNVEPNPAVFHTPGLKGRSAPSANLKRFPRILRMISAFLGNLRPPQRKVCSQLVPFSIVSQLGCSEACRNPSMSHMLRTHPGATSRGPLRPRDAAYRGDTQGRRLLGSVRRLGRRVQLGSTRPAFATASSHSSSGLNSLELDGQPFELKKPSRGPTPDAHPKIPPLEQKRSFRQ
jgi:hypothetical protein